MLIDSIPVIDIGISVDGEIQTTPFMIEAEGKKGAKKAEIALSVEEDYLLDLKQWFPGHDTKAIFREWTGHLSSEENTISLSVAPGRCLTAVFDLEFRLLYLEKFDNNPELENEDRSGWFSAGETVTFEPIGHEGYQFVRWAVQISELTPEYFSQTSQGVPLTLCINSPVIVKAIYETEEGSQ